MGGKFKVFSAFGGILILLLSTWAVAQPPKEVLIGAVYAMTGPQALTGTVAKFAIETAEEIVNKKFDLNLPLARAEGLPNLGGAKIKVIMMDHEGSPEKAMAATEKLITQDKVVAVVGCYQSSVAAVSSEVCERYHIPFLALESSSPSLSRRNLKWFFRTSPDDESFSRTMFEFMNDLKQKKGIKIETIALLHEDTLFGSDTSAAQLRFAKEFGYRIVTDIKYRSKSTSLISEIQKLKVANPDVVLGTSYISDAILLTKTMKDLNYMPRILIGQDAGWSDPELVREMGKDVDGFSSRNVFSMDLGEKRPLVKAVNELYKKRANRDLTDNSSRELMGIIVLADAINRAKSTSPEAIRKALHETDIKPEELIMPWKGVRFGPDGQNILGTAIMTQWHNGEMVTVWPFELAKINFIYPIPKWSGR